MEFVLLYYLLFVVKKTGILDQNLTSYYHNQVGFETTLEKKVSTLEKKVEMYVKWLVKTYCTISLYRANNVEI